MEIPPAFNMQAIPAHRATADVAMLQLEMPPNGKNPAMLGVPQFPIVAGSRFTIVGIGVAIRGEGSSGGPPSPPGPAGPPPPPRVGNRPRRPGAPRARRGASSRSPGIRGPPALALA